MTTKSMNMSGVDVSVDYRPGGKSGNVKASIGEFPVAGTANELRAFAEMLLEAADEMEPTYEAQFYVDVRGTEEEIREAVLGKLNKHRKVVQ